jgi:3-oxoacyl-[acyl-carrier protein] reductase
MTRFDGKVALVTGAGGGLGRAEALLLAADGACVVVNNRTRDGRSSTAEAVVEEICASGGRAVASNHDIAGPDGANGAVATAINAFGSLDILINNAAVVRVGAIEELSEETWDEVLNISLRGTFLVCRAAIQYLRAGDQSVILNTGSESGHGHAYLGAYAAAKEALIGLTGSLARELAADGIRCNVVRPRVLGTPMGARFDEDVAPYLGRLAPLGRYQGGERTGVGGAGTAEEAAPFAVWLCSRAAAGITGHVFSIEGDTVGLWAPPSLTRTATHAGTWTLDALDEIVPGTVALDLGGSGIGAFLPNDSGA